MFLDLVNQRESCRVYDKRRVDRKIIERCLEAARLAPSACNSQPWTFMVVRRPDLKDKVAQAAFGGIYGMNRFAGEADTLVCVLRERSKKAAQAGQMVMGTQFNLIDMGIAVEHFVLQAAEEGVGTCWLGWFNQRAVKKALGLPRQKKVAILISMGYPSPERQGDSPRDKKRKPLNEMSEIIE